MHRRLDAVRQVGLEQFGVQNIVLVEPIENHVIVLRPALGLHVERSTGLAPDRCVVGVRLHAELLHRVHGRDERDVPASLRVGHAVEHKVVRVNIVAPTVRRELRSADVRPRPHDVVVLVLRHHPGRQYGEQRRHVRERRHLGHLLRGDDGPRRGGGGVDESGLGRHFH